MIVERILRPNHFDRDASIELLLLGLVDIAHPAVIDELDDLVARNRRQLIRVRRRRRKERLQAVKDLSCLIRFGLSERSKWSLSKRHATFPKHR